VHNVHGHVAFSPVVRGTGYNETLCASKYETHNGGLPGKASGLVRETACYGPNGDPSLCSLPEHTPCHNATMSKWRTPE
jgi:hypothetical protein